MSTTLLLGGRIHAPAAPDATAMAVADGEVVWLGGDADGRARFPGAEPVALDGAFVAPAFVDAHVHGTGSGLLLKGLDLTGCASLDELLDAVRDRAVQGTVLLGHGWDETAWPQRRPPTRAELDAAADGVPVCLSRIDAHSALVSSALVAMAPGARSADGWSERGPLSRAAHHEVRRVALESITPEQRRAAQLAFLRHAASRGVACVHECAGPEISGADDFADLLALAGKGLPEVVGYWGELGATSPAARGLAGDLFVDGALGSRTAALCEPYLDEPGSTGALYLDADQIAQHLISCTEAGIQAGFHVIGDAAVTTVVEGFARAEKIVGEQALGAVRHRLEHLEMINAVQAEELARFGVVASVQPQFDAAWGGRSGMYAQRLGPDRGSALNPFAQLAGAGVILALGSDSPVTPVDPWATVRAAVHHRTPGFGLAPGEAFAAHTAGGWRASGVDGLAGTLSPGAPATYAVYRTGELVGGLPVLNPDAELPTCLRTVRNGHPIYEAP